MIGANDARAGCVKIFDVVRLRTLAFFRAHWHALGSSAVLFVCFCVSVNV